MYHIKKGKQINFERQKNMNAYKEYSSYINLTRKTFKSDY